MTDLKNFQRKFNTFFLKSLKKNISQAKKHTTDTTIHTYLDYILEIGQSGKRIRPFIASLVVDTYSKEKNPHLLLGLEYLHLFALIHDDIIDSAPLRHGVMTIHEYTQKKLGLTPEQSLHQSLLVGDLVFHWANEHMYLASRDTPALWSEYSHLVKELVVGQMLDSDLPRRTVIKSNLIDEKNKIKTGRYTFARPMMLGALYVELPPKQVRMYFNLGETIGELFQLVDDFIDATTHSKELGKKVFQDFNEKQHTHLSLYLSQYAPQKYQKIFKEKMWGKSITEDDFKWVQTVLFESGLLDYVEKLKKNLLVKIREQISLLPASEIYKQKWNEITNTLYNRTK